MQSGSIAGSRKLVKIRLREVRWQQELGGLKCIGQTRLRGSFIIRVLQLIHQWIDFDLKGCEEVFRRVLWFSLRQHVLVLSCVCISLPLLLCFTFIAYCSCLCSRVVLLIALLLLLFRTWISQCKSNLTIILKLRSKQARVFQHKSELYI